MISIDEFRETELRVGMVREATRVEGSEKLLRLSVDLGEKNEAGLSAVRQILAGIGKAYAPEAMLGKQIVLVVNLEPRKLMGLESNGMLLAAHDAEGNPVILTPDGNAKIGSKVQ